jgi:hypothetical protein
MNFASGDSVHTSNNAALSALRAPSMLIPTYIGQSLLTTIMKSSKIPKTTA